MKRQIIRGPILSPQADGKVAFIPDGALVGDEAGLIAFVGAWNDLKPLPPEFRCADGIICPPFLDNHIHIPQHPIRGHFTDGVEASDAGGRLIAGLNRNVWPAEVRFGDLSYAEQIIREFQEDTLAHGVVGGAAYATVHYPALQRALEILPRTWHVGLVLMERECPKTLRTDVSRLDETTALLAAQFGRRLIMTDRFAVVVTPGLRRRASHLARQFGLRTQTHLNEQISEKQLVETKFYPDAASYTDAYARDGLLDHDAILAHCIRMRGEEFDLVASKGASIAHCPTSNTMLGSGIMPLDEIVRRKIPYAICTDVGASPTTSLLAEIAQFLKVHAGRSRHATPQEALFRVTLAAARMLGVEDQVGSLSVGKPMSFIEIASGPDLSGSVDDVILRHLLDMTPADLASYATRPDYNAAFTELAAKGLDAGQALSLLTNNIEQTARRLDRKVSRVTLAGQTAWERAGKTA